MMDEEILTYRLTDTQRDMVMSVRRLAQQRFKDRWQQWQDGTFPWENMRDLAEIGGAEEEELAAALNDRAFEKPCHCLIAGATAPSGKTLGHAGALIHGFHGSFPAKATALERAGAVVHRNIESLIKAMTT